MFSTKRNNLIPAAVAIATLLLLMPSFAVKAMDGSKDIVCAVRDVVGCLETGGCAQSDAREFNLPGLFIFNAEEKAVRGAHGSGKDAISQVKSIEVNTKHLILQGVENSRGWDIAVNMENGNMSGAGVGDGVSFLVFGVCTAL